jgi:predicted secreted Zn-dependent protease
VFIALTRASGLNDPKFWATIPENIKRHEEAQEIGRLIFRHFNQRL